MKKFLLSICCLLGMASAATAGELGTAFTQDFTQGKGDFTIDNKTIPEELSAIWTEAGNYGMKATAYFNSKNYASESWLISPVVDLTGSSEVEFTFNQATNFFTSVDVAKSTEATVWGRVENGTWEQLTTSDYPTSMSWSFVVSKADISKFAGKKMQFAFVYKSEAKAGTWEIKNVTVKGDGATVEPEPEVPEPADDDITLMFGADYNSTSVSSYASTWNVTVNGLTWTIENFNNNNNGWEYVKCGRKNVESTGYITTDFSINEAVSAVQLTVDALTAAKVSSISLLVASSDQFTDAATYTVTPAQGTLTINITAPAAKKFYRLAVACEGGSSNGLFTLSKVVYLGGKTATAEEVPEVKAESLADFIAKTPEKNDEAVMDCPLTVVYVNGAYVYVKDETASSLIYKNNLGYEKGDVIPGGWKGANGTFNGLYEIVPKTEMPAATETATVVYPEVTSVNLDMVNQVVILKNVTFEAETPAETANFTGKLADDTEVTFRNAFKIASVAAGEYNVTLAVARYNANLQVYPIEYNATSAIEAIADDNAAAEYFNLQGMSIDADNLTPGIYVRRQGNKVSKVIVK